MAYTLTLGVELMAALILLLLWSQDRTRDYLVWWAVSHLSVPCLWVAAATIYAQDAVVAQVSIAGYITAAVVGAVSQTEGALRFRGLPTRTRTLVLAGGALLIALPFSMLGAEIEFMRQMTAITISIAFAGTAIALWPLGRMVRVAAFAFGLRTLVNLFSVVILAYYLPFRYPDGLAWSVALLTVATAVLTVVIAFNQLLADLRGQYRFLALSQEISNALQGLLDEKEMARRVIDLFIQHRMWDIGALMLYDADAGDFEVIYTTGKGLSPELQQRFRRIPFSGLGGAAFSSRRLVYSMNAARDTRLSKDLRDAARDAGSSLQICIPLIHDDTALGVVILRDRQISALMPQEIETMESLGKVIGMGLANLRNLATMAFRATHDPLTGLDNRAALHEWFATRPAGCVSTLMLFDLNGFKEVNDALGHSVGDELLKELAKRLQQSLASEHVHVFRLGGDEFVIFHDDAVDDRENTRRAHRLAELIAQPFNIAGVCLRTSASIGIAEAPRHGKTSHELLRCADLAMYQAKNNGWTIAIYEQGRDEDVRDRIQLVSGVIDGIERDEFELHYQPFIDLRDGSCRGCEALLRWHHPTRGLLGAGAFMPFVEATDLIHPLTQRVAELAIRDAAAWQARGMPLKVSINLSARNLLDADLPEQLLRLARQHHLDPAYLQLEITETVLMKDPIAATSILQRLRDAGFTMALDDFGTGYSSLAYLARFPIHTLKIDQSFVRNMASDRRSRSIVQSTVELAHMLDLTVTAEGIEGTAEAKLLTDFGCDVGQGYLYARPLQRSEFEHWWRKRRETPAFAI